MTKNRFLTLAAASCLLVSMLAGCGSNNSPAATQAPATNKPATQAPANTAPDAVVEDEPFSYPVQPGKTLTVWSSFMSPASVYVDYTESPFHTGLAENTGIDVKWQFPAAGIGDTNQAFSLLMASNDYPDVILHNLLTDADRYIDERVFRDLTDVLPEHAPNYWAFLQANDYYSKSMKTDSGKYPGFGVFRESEWNNVYVGPVVRVDWLAEQGLSKPETIADWDNVMRVFHEKYDARLAFANMRFIPGLAGAFGAHVSFGTWNGNLFFVDDNNRIQFSMAQPEWKTYMEQLHSWYAEDLIDPDTITIDDGGMRTKALNNRVGIAVTSMGQMTNWITDAENDNTGAQWEGLAYPVVNKGDKVVSTQMEDSAKTWLGVITNACADDKVGLAARWMDYFFSEEGILYSNFGTEGVSFTYVDGVPTYTELVTGDPGGLGSGIDKYASTNATSIGIQATGLVVQKNKPVSVEAVNTWLLNQETQKHMIPSGISRTAEESDEISNLLGSISTYVNEMSVKFMAGEESLENYDAFVNTLNTTMNLGRALELYQAGYDRFLNR